MTRARRPPGPLGGGRQRREAVPLAWDPPFELTVYWAGQDDPKKNTARKLARHGMVHLVEHPRQLPGGAVLLDPMASKALSREDLPLLESHGLAAIDCSWAQVERTYLGLRRRMEPRALPFLVAGNPTRYGKAFELSTAEAMAAALCIVGEWDAAQELMRVFPWAKTFFAVNREPLEAYAEAATSAEVVAAQDMFLDADEGDGASGDEAPASAASEADADAADPDDGAGGAGTPGKRHRDL